MPTLKKKIEETVADPFYSEKNQAELARIISEYKSGKSKLIYKTIEELEAMENEKKFIIFAGSLEKIPLTANLKRL